MMYLAQAFVAGWVAMSSPGPDAFPAAKVYPSLSECMANLPAPPAGKTVTCVPAYAKPGASKFVTPLKKG